MVIVKAAWKRQIDKTWRLDMAYDLQLIHDAGVELEIRTYNIPKS
jgi:hypothetical protein